MGQGETMEATSAPAAVSPTVLRTEQIVSEVCHKQNFKSSEIFYFRSQERNNAMNPKSI